jgi:hypothetical protein
MKDKSFCRFPPTGNTCKTCVNAIEKANKPKKVKKTIESSITDALVGDNKVSEGQDTPLMTDTASKETQPIDIQGVKDDKIDDKNLVTGTPVKTLKKRGRPKKLSPPDDIEYGGKNV